MINHSTPNEDDLLVGLERHGGETFLRRQGKQIRFLVLVVLVVVVVLMVVVVVLINNASVRTIAGFSVLGAWVLYRLSVLRSPLGPLSTKLVETTQKCGYDEPKASNNGSKQQKNQT